MSDSHIYTILTGMENTPSQDPRSKQKLVLLGTLAVALIAVTAIVIGVYLILVREIQ